MKWNFLYQITAASRTPEGLPPPDPLSLCPLSSTEFVDPPEQNSWVRHCSGWNLIVNWSSRAKIPDTYSTGGTDTQAYTLY